MQYLFRTRKCTAKRSLRKQWFAIFIGMDVDYFQYIKLNEIIENFYTKLPEVIFRRILNKFKTFFSHKFIKSFIIRHGPSPFILNMIWIQQFLETNNPRKLNERTRTFGHLNRQISRKFSEDFPARGKFESENGLAGPRAHNCFMIAASVASNKIMAIGSAQ